MHGRVEGSTVYFTCLVTRCNIKFAVVTLVRTRASDLCTCIHDLKLYSTKLLIAVRRQK